MRKISGGLTLMGVARGQWINNETKELVAERMIPVRIACTEAQINRIVDFTITHYNQDMVFAYEIAQKVIFRAKK